MWRHKFLNLLILVTSFYRYYCYKFGPAVWTKANIAHNESLIRVDCTN